MRRTRFFATSVLFLTLALPAFGQSVDPVLLRGRWGGTVAQEGVKEYKGQIFFYTLSLHIVKLLEDEQSGTMWWPEAGCRANLTLIHYTEGVFRFATRPVDKSPKHCLPTMLTIKLPTTNKAEVAFYYRTMPKPIAEGTLRRLAPVEFKEHLQQ
jgi:hypothetical protein